MAKFRLYNCNICHDNTIHQLVEEDTEQFLIECTSCGTTSVAHPRGFNNYEEAIIDLNNQLQGVIEYWGE